MSDFAQTPKIKGMGSYKPVSNPNGRSFVVRKRPYSSILILDNFGGSGSLDAHTPDINIPGNSWVESLGDWEVSGGSAILAASSNSYATIDSGVSNYIVYGEITIGADPIPANRGHIVRYLDNNDMWRCVLASGRAEFEIQEQVEGVGITVRASISSGIDENATFTIKTICNGQSITSILDGNKTLSYGSATTQETQTIVGLLSRTTDDTHNYFEVSEL